MGGERTATPPRRVDEACTHACFRQVRLLFVFSFALDLKSEIKQELFYNNVSNNLLEKLVGTGSIKISRTVLTEWDPEQN